MAGKAIIDQDRAARGEENIFRFQIEMDHLLPVQRANGCGDGNGNDVEDDDGDDNEEGIGAAAGGGGGGEYCFNDVAVVGGGGGVVVPSRLVRSTNA